MIRVFPYIVGRVCVREGARVAWRSIASVGRGNIKDLSLCTIESIWR
jgi:hypothetical protein